MARFEDNNRCALCGKPKEDGRKVIVGLHGAVCSDCVSLCSEILGAHQESGPRPDPLAGVLEQLGLKAATPPVDLATPLASLIAMTLALADPRNGQVILAEGNTSCRDGDTLWIKASGCQMCEIGLDGFVQVDLHRVVQILDRAKPTDEESRQLLNAARTDPSASNYPSTETFMHAWLLTLPGVNFVAHTHPTTTLGVMCGLRARQFAEQRFFPDQIVLCGPSSQFVPYCAPGFDLAIAVRDACQGTVPKTILLENHGVIALGRTANEALAACLMMEKAAQVFVAADDPHPLTPDEVAHIHNWTDEHYRQNKLWNNE